MQRLLSTEVDSAKAKYCYNVGRYPINDNHPVRNKGQDYSTYEITAQIATNFFSLSNTCMSLCSASSLGHLINLR